jgi:hypothetical protein
MRSTTLRTTGFRLLILLAGITCLWNVTGCSSTTTSTYASGDPDSSDKPTIKSLNGKTKECEVYSSKSGGTYTLEVEFEGDTAQINFPTGGYKVVDIDSPDSTDFTSISTTDSNGDSWDITVSDPPTTND